MKKSFSALLIALATSLFYSACGSGKSASPDAPDPKDSKNQPPPAVPGQSAPSGSLDQNPNAERIISVGESLDFSGHKFRAISSTTLRLYRNELSGSGTLVAYDPVHDGVASDNRYDVQFALNESGTIKIKMQGNNDLSEAIAVKFTRAGESLKVELSKANQETDISKFFSSQKASGALGFSTDVHNGETPAHVLMWAMDLTSARGPSNALVNTQSDAISVQEQGAGAFWGVELDNATLKSAEVGAPNFLHRH